MARHELLHLQRVGHGGRPFALGKAQCRALVAPVLVARAGVIMQREPVDILARKLHQRFGPRVIGIARAAGDLQHRSAGRFGELRIAVGQVGGIFGAHVAPASPQFVADPQILHLPRRRTAIGGALPGQHARAGRRGQIFHPLCGLGRRRAAQIGRHIGLRPQPFDEPHELVRAERIVLGHAAPVGVHLHRAPAARADAVAPVIFVGETAARPAHHRHLDRLQRRNHVAAITAVVRDLRIAAHPQAAIDAGAQMLGELPEHLPVHPRAGPVRRQRHGGDADRLAGHRSGRLRACGQRRGQHDAGKQRAWTDPVRHSALPDSALERGGLMIQTSPIVRVKQAESGQASDRADGAACRAATARTAVDRGGRPPG